MKRRRRRLLGVVQQNLALPFSEELGLPALIAALALIFLMPVFCEGPGSLMEALIPSGVVCLTAVAVYSAASGLFGAQLGALLGVAMLTRLVTCLVFYSVCNPPFTDLESGVQVPSVFVYSDDVHYVGAAEKMLRAHLAGVDSTPADLHINDKIYRIALPIYYCKRLLGEEQVWVRLMNILVGSVTVVVAGFGIRGLFSRRIESFCVALICFGPHFVQSSLLLYKEIYAILAGAVSLCALRYLLKKPGSFLTGLALLGISLIALYWVRREMVVVMAGVGFAAICVAPTSAGQVKSVLLVCCLFVGISFGVLRQNLEITERVHGQLEESMESFGNAQTFGWASGLPGPLRVIHLPISLANPPPGLLSYYLRPSPGNWPWLRVVVRELVTVQWWIMLPWILLGIYALPKAGNTVIIVLPFLIAWAATAFIYNGNHPEVVRYRSTFLAMAVVLAGLGAQSNASGRYSSFVTSIYVSGLALTLFMMFRTGGIPLD